MIDSKSKSVLQYILKIWLFSKVSRHKISAKQPIPFPHTINRQLKWNILLKDEMTMTSTNIKLTKNKSHTEKICKIFMENIKKSEMILALLAI